MEGFISKNNQLPTKSHDEVEENSNTHFETLIDVWDVGYIKGWRLPSKLKKHIHILYIFFLLRPSHHHNKALNPQWAPPPPTTFCFFLGFGFCPFPVWNVWQSGPKSRCQSQGATRGDAHLLSAVHPVTWHGGTHEILEIWASVYTFLLL